MFKKVLIINVRGKCAVPEPFFSKFGRILIFLLVYLIYCSRSKRDILGVELEKDKKIIKCLILTSR